MARNVAGILVAVATLVALAVGLVLVFEGMQQGRLQSPAQAPPTPVPKPVPPLLTSVVITPTGTVTPPPVPSVIVDPNLTRPAPTPFPIGPTVTPRPATGGPYISEAKAIEIALRGARSMGQVDESVPPRAVFARSRDVPTILGDGRETPRSDLEIWVVFLKGRFRAQSVPQGAPITIYEEAYVVMNATTGFTSEWGLRRVVP